MRKSYSDGTPVVRWCYDGRSYEGGNCSGTRQTLKIGRLTAVGSTTSVTAMASYDALGRVLASQQTTGGTTYNFGYSYNLADGLTRMQYPSGSAVSYAHDDAGRVTTVKKGEQTSSVKYAEGVSYAPHGAMTAMTLGNGMAESRSYNGRLQPVTITAVKDPNTQLSLTNG